jgi:hypothetical protein
MRLIHCDPRRIELNGQQGKVFMKNIFGRLAIIVAMGSLLSLSVFAKTTKKEVSFANDVTVSGTLVKSGTYTAVFDDATNQLSIMKGNKSIATSSATLEKIEKGGNTEVSYSTNSGILATVGMKGGYQAVLSGGSASSGM